MLYDQGFCEKNLDEFRLSVERPEPDESMMVAISSHLRCSTMIEHGGHRAHLFPTCFFTSHILQTWSERPR